MRSIILLFFSITLFSQTKKLDTVFCDCAKAKALTVNSKTVYGKTISPPGFGDIKEISHSKQNTPYAFEKEHHSSWHKLIINATGEMTFIITPGKKDDDYDFMLFKSVKNDFCDSLQKHKLNPIRACISRDKEELNGKTGLNLKSKNDFAKHGVGSAYCKSVPVKKGEIYYLVLDNVYDKGDGYTLDLEISQPVSFSGIVTNESNNPVKAEIALTNQKGDTLLIESTKDDGTYNFVVPLTKNQSYNLNFYNDSTFSFTKTFSLADTIQLRALKTVLPKLKKGSKYSVGTINFIGGSVQYLSQAIPSMNNLAKLLKKNKSLKIKIIGHSNGRDMLDEKGVLAFTRGRANTIKNYLAIQGIDEKRMEIDGKGDHEMLFKLPKATAEQQEQNRRVEILVLEY
ncbi:MAG: OmpA family protein [Bacteroidota bacterium]|jgi:outer membrane protein OmpA-like peptidoglycan-associated protein|nr:OmpA family protein [Bacteroidota bacterium]